MTIRLAFGLAVMLVCQLTFGDTVLITDETELVADCGEHAELSVVPRYQHRGSTFTAVCHPANEFKAYLLNDDRDGFYRRLYELDDGVHLGLASAWLEAEMNERHDGWWVWHLNYALLRTKNGHYADHRRALHGGNVLHELAWCGAHRTLAELLTRSDQSHRLEQRDHRDMTPLMVATLRLQAESAAVLMEHGADLHGSEVFEWMHFAMRGAGVFANPRANCREPDVTERAERIAWKPIYRRSHAWGT